MFKLFTKKKRKSDKEIIQEIHNSFYTEVDRLLEEAGITQSKKKLDGSIAERAYRLQQLGFTSMKEVKQMEEVEVQNIRIEMANREKQELKEAIEYFSMKYPNYKFITKNSVKKICKKYGLVLGGVSNYKGDVPEKNLRHIEQFKVDKEDKVYLNDYFSRSLNSYEEIKYQIKHRKKNKYWNGYREAPLEIVAPLKDFDTKDSRLNGFELKKSVPDPVVLQPVMYKNKYEKYYLIVTAWGDEASDDLVVNERFN